MNQRIDRKEKPSRVFTRG